MNAIFIAVVAAINIHSGSHTIKSDAVLLGTSLTGKKYYQVAKPLIDIRYLSENDDKLMNRLILDGHAVVLEDDPMLSSDDSYCSVTLAPTDTQAMACNCRCCFNLQSLGKTVE